MSTRRLAEMPVMNDCQVAEGIVAAELAAQQKSVRSVSMVDVVLTGRIYECMVKWRGCQRGFQVGDDKVWEDALLGAAATVALATGV